MIMVDLLEILKKLPIDLGQGNTRFTTKGKLIASTFVKNVDGKSALDIGCREGAQSKWLERKGYKVISIDIERRYAKCIIVDANKKLPFKDDFFDLIWCSEVIEHLDSPTFSISEFRRVLKPGGEIVATTPNSYCWIFLFGLLAKKMQRKDHKHFFKIKDIQRLFPMAYIYGYFPYWGRFRYKIDKIIGVLSPTFVVWEKKN